jgi:8-oxo-dGTP pyrophosphatase MutT (NUDIX family)
VDRERSPWRRVARRTAYENAWITVWHDEVLRPDGEPGIYGVVHYRSLAVGVVALDGEDRVVLVGQYRYTLDAWSWEIPEGGVPLDDDPLEGAQRELREETGFKAAEWHELGRVHLSNSVSDEAGILYLATGLMAGAAAPDETEELEVRLVPFADALAMTLDGRITDTLSVVAIQRVALARAAGAADVTARNVAPR